MGVTFFELVCHITGALIGQHGSVLCENDALFSIWIFVPASLIDYIAHQG